MNKFDRLGFKAKLWNGKWLTAEMYSDHLQTFGMLWADWNVHMTMAKIDPETICLSTGLRDSNGALIYEHDIIEVRDVKGDRFMEKSEVLHDGCEWNKDCGFVCSIRGLLGLYREGKVKIFVIGNALDEK